MADDQDDPTWAARTMRELTPDDRNRLIAWGVLSGVVVEARAVFWDLRTNNEGTVIRGEGIFG